MFWTLAHMNYVERELRAYVATHHHLPNSYADLPKEARLDVYTLDGWKRPISYTRQSDGSVLLSSQEKDGTKVFAIEFAVPGAATTQPTTKASKEPRPDIGDDKKTIQ
jgi:hypothetical protein